MIFPVFSIVNRKLRPKATLVGKISNNQKAKENNVRCEIPVKMGDMSEEITVLFSWNLRSVKYERKGESSERRNVIGGGVKVKTNLS